MSLIEQQHAFIAEIAADDDVPSSGPGMAIYRNAYRARLADALSVSFERTRRWVGDDMFELAAAHYILSHPPRSWTLDAYGADFPQTLGELFADDPEVAELAWLEWHMQQAFAAPDRERLTAESLAAAGLNEADWENLCLAPATGLAWQRVWHDLAGLWRKLADGPPPERQLAGAGPSVLLVWRQDLSPHFRLLAPDEFAALEPLLSGTSFGQTASRIGEEGLPRLGQWFAQWLQEGVFSAIRSPA